MRHVILGSDTTLGSSILRVLVSIGNQEIVCCNPEGMIPIDVPTTNITTFNVDIKNIQMLEAILQEGDILYNAQVFDDENVISQDFDELHVSGIKNLLNIANKKKVKKVVSYLPQKISWAVPDHATEEINLIPTTEYQKSLSKTLQTAKLYFDQTLFAKEMVQNNIESEPEIDENNTIQDVGDLESNESVEISNGIDDENQNHEVAGALPDPPSLQSSPPSLEISSSNNEASDEEVDTVEIQPPIIDEASAPKDDNEKNIVNMEPNEEEANYEVPLVLARISRFYGPFDYSITKKVCQGTRLQRINLVGKLRRKISWINPLDAGRAMIIMGDDKVKQGQYNITGFEATGSELIEAMEQINYSKTKIRRKLFFISNISTKIKLLLSKLGFINRIEFDEIYGLNRQQVYSDDKAQTEWNWKPKYDLIITSKDSLNWYVNHVL